MEQHIPLLATNWFRNNHEHYVKVRARLSAIHQKFMEASMSEKVLMLQKSHAFSVISIQARVQEHEQAFKQLFANGLPHTEQEILNSIDNVIYYNNKASYIWDSLTNGKEWEKIARLLMNDDVDKAHKRMIDNIRGLSTVKAPFCLAMLGFTEKMCIDTNIANLMGIEKPTTVVIERYNQTVESLKSKFQTLVKETKDNFMFQWVLFDYVRNELTLHDTFFNELGVL
jgi:hypothetical protein